MKNKNVLLVIILVLIIVLTGIGIGYFIYSGASKKINVEIQNQNGNDLESCISVKINEKEIAEEIELSGLVTCKYEIFNNLVLLEIYNNVSSYSDLYIYNSKAEKLVGLSDIPRELGWKFDKENQKIIFYSEIVDETKDILNKETFINEANIAIDGASNAMSLISLGSVSNSNYTTGTDASGNTTYCFTLQNLKDLSLWDKDDANYAGKVVVTVPASGGYSYELTMHNKDYYVTGSGTIASNAVVDYDVVGTHKTANFEC